MRENVFCVVAWCYETNKSSLAKAMKLKNTFSHCLELIDLHLGHSPRPQMFVWVRTCVVRFSKAVDRWTRCAQFLERHARDLFLLLHLAHCSPTSPLWFSVWFMPFRGGKKEWNRAVTATFPLMLPLVSVWALVGVEKWHQSSFHAPVLKL